MVNINKLKGKIVECGMNISQFAERIGMDKATLYRKLNGDGENILIKEAGLMAVELSMTSEEVNAIFFSQIVA